MTVFTGSSAYADDDKPGTRESRMIRLRPRVPPAIEEAVLLVVVRGLAVRLDRADLGERGLHRGPLVDRLEPAREIGIVSHFTPWVS